MRTINLKENDYSVEQAIFFLDKEIHDCKQEGIPIFKIITGYGSHGVGGIIKVKVNIHLKQLLKKGEITDYIDGTKWSLFNHKAFKYLAKFPTVTDEDFNIINGGIIFIIV